MCVCLCQGVCVNSDEETFQSLERTKEDSHMEDS